MYISRRKFCVKGLVALAGLRVIDAARAAAVGVGEKSYDGYAFDRSGNVSLDVAMIAILKKITAILGISPGFKYIDEDNAYATSDALVGETNGTIFLGVPLLTRLLNKRNGGALVAGVCAHECGHIYQYTKNSLIERLNEKGVAFAELHADFISGYCLNKLKIVPAGDIVGFSFQFFDSIDDHHDVDHKGTLTQRAAALAKGFSTANNGEPITVATESGFLFVTKML